jgi:hypothetical protein
MLLEKRQFGIAPNCRIGEGTTCMNLVDQVALHFYKALELPNLSDGFGNFMLPCER